MRKTKIICTLGPTTAKEGVVEKLIEKGMDVARFNFSHDSHEVHKERLIELRELSKKHHKHVAALLDTKGPEIRIRDFENGKITLKKGQQFTLTTREVMGNEEIVSVSYKNLPDDVEVGGSILIDDGLIGLEIVDIKDGTDIVCEVKNGGVISNKKGVNVPDANLTMPFISDQDRKDIVFGIQNDFDFIAASFTRTAEDIKAIRKILVDNEKTSTKIIAKIENIQGVNNIDEILEVADGIMVARGDMGVEIPNEEVPVIQKELIKKGVTAGKLVITATQMLDSMIKNPRPTRAETADVANAIYDGTSAIMLSGETACGAYPIEALETMARIAERTERDIDYKKRFFQNGGTERSTVTSAICHATVTTALDLDAKAIVTITKSGRSARKIAKNRPDKTIIACATSEKVCRQLMLTWGVVPVLVEEKTDLFDLFKHSIDEAKKTGMVEDGDIVVITAGIPLGIPGQTNMIKVHTVGESLDQNS